MTIIWFMHLKILKGLTFYQRKGLRNIESTGIWNYSALSILFLCINPSSFSLTFYSFYQLSIHWAFLHFLTFFSVPLYNVYNGFKIINGSMKIKIIGIDSRRLSIRLSYIDQPSDVSTID